jgi:hypothetical protein
MANLKPDPEPKPNPFDSQSTEKLELLSGSPYKREKNRHINVCNQYLRMGQGRSLAKLHIKLTEAAQLHGGKVPSERTLKEWSANFDWVDRSVQYDRMIAAQDDEINEEFRRQYLLGGLALPENRIEHLTQLEESLFRQVMNPDDLWLTEMKNIRDSDGTWAKTEIRRFNGVLVQQWRGILDDIAKEVGDRKDRVLHGGDPDAPAIETNLTTHLDTVRQLKEAAKNEVAQFDPYNGNTGRKNPFDESGESDEPNE